MKLHNQPSRAQSLLNRKTLFQLIAFIATLILFYINLPIIISYSQDSLTNAHANAIVTDCRHAADQEICYTDHFTILTREHSLEYTLQVLTNVQKKDARSQGCHFIGHVIGAEEVKKDPQSWEDVIAKLPITRCTGGFLMGALEEHKSQDKAFVLNAQTIPQICNRVLNTTKQTGSDMTCVHTSGHLLLIEKKGNVRQTIAECQKLPSVFVYECSSGTFMENIYRRNLAEHGIGTKLTWNQTTLSEQQQFCNTFTSLPQQACWRELSHMIVALNNHNTQTLFSTCSSAKEQLAKDSCFLHGVSVILLTAKKGESDTKMLCKPVEGNDLYKKCIRLKGESVQEEI